MTGLDDPNAGDDAPTGTASERADTAPPRDPQNLFALDTFSRPGCHTHMLISN